MGFSHLTNNKSTNETWDLVIEAGKTERQYWRDLWKYRELFGILAWRDLLVRYKQTVFGVAWSVIRPVATMIVFTFVFGRVAKMPSGGVPYPVLVYAAVLPWQFFSNALSDSSSSLVNNANLISKVYFPRLIIPTSTVIVSLVDFGVSFVIYLGLMVGFGVPFQLHMVTIPLFLLLTFLTAMGAGLLVCALNVKYRDFRYVIPFIVQFGLYISPVGFSSNVVPASLRLLYSVNPLVGVIDGFRWALLPGQPALYLPGFLLSVGLAGFLLWLGIWYFRRTELGFADMI